MGKIDTIMKGTLQTTELIDAVIAPDSGLRTERRLSHVFAMDAPTYSKPLFITDAAINTEPAAEEKRDFVQNAIDLLHTLGDSMPRLAILAAVETVNPKMRATIDGAMLCRRADRGQITGGTLDGPLGFDNAISLDAGPRHATENLRVYGLVFAGSKTARNAVNNPADVCVPSATSGAGLESNAVVARERGGCEAVLAPRERRSSRQRVWRACANRFHRPRG